jgi:hypothetical protein
MLEPEGFNMVKKGPATAPWDSADAFRLVESIPISSNRWRQCFLNPNGCDGSTAACSPQALFCMQHCFKTWKTLPQLPAAGKTPLCWCS